MTGRDFCYWLQGFFELSSAGQSLTVAQTQAIKNHLAMVFVHEIDPSHGPAEHQAKLSAAHAGGAAGADPKPKTKTKPHYQRPSPGSLLMRC